jgi:hypothetical protein
VHRSNLEVGTGGTGREILTLEMTRAEPHLATRTFSRSRYVPEQVNSVSVEVQVDPAAPPNAVIVSETLPDSWAYASASTTAVDGAPLDEPRRDGNRLSWIFWRGLETETLFRYGVRSGATEAESVHFAGELSWTGGAADTVGDSLWMPAVERTVSRALSPGWNLVSVPLIPAAEDVERNFRDFHIWEWDGRQYRKARSLDPKKGYWLYADGRGDSFVVRGWEEQEEKQVLTNGWNLFGVLADMPAPVSEYFSGPVWRWSGQFLPADTLRGGDGYWVLCREPVTISLR